ncbi:hypothetical protein HAX54_044961 [Datura stramonium]|uniref:Uncharacterized protein n=1 Tax=Datura stramonium TaxID=4076 RepID=A0ABS8SQ02_DATST|nr:hypothetical protein [Datura stramonium]
MEESDNEDILALVAISNSDEEEEELQVDVEGIGLIPDSPDEAHQEDSVEEPSPRLTVMKTPESRETEEEPRVLETGETSEQTRDLAFAEHSEGRSSYEPGRSCSLGSQEIQASNWKHKKSHPFQNILTLFASGIQTRS